MELIPFGNAAAKYRDIRKLNRRGGENQGHCQEDRATFKLFNLFRNGRDIRKLNLSR